MSNAIFLRSFNEELFLKAQRTVNELTQNKTNPFVLFTTTGLTSYDGSNEKEETSPPSDCFFLSAIPENHFDSIHLAPGFPLYNTNYNKVFLAELYNKIKPGGKLIISFSSDLLSLKKEDLQFLGDFYPTNVKNIFYIERTNNKVNIPEKSIVNWVVHNQSLIEASLAQSAHAYLLAGVNYKGAIINSIIREYFKQNNPLHYYDLGGAAGFLATEMLYENSNITRAESIDIFSYEKVIESLTTYDPFLENKLFFSNLSLEDYIGYGKTDIISIIGALLYVAKEKQQQTVRQAWDALNKGGILIIHENIKHPNYKKDFSVMFEPEELDELLGAFAPISYYSSVTGQKMSAKDVERKTVFRVIQKT